MKHALSHEIVTYIYHLFSIPDMLTIEIVFKMSYISKSCYYAYQYTLDCK